MASSGWLVRHPQYIAQNWVFIYCYLHVESRDLGEAMKKVEAYANENMKLKSQLMELIEKLEESARETTDLKLLKMAAMDMVRF